MAQEGGCFCANVRYSIEGEPVMKALCHCTDCKKITGSTYSTNAVYPEGGFKVLKGTAKQHTVTSDSGNKITSHFCGDCGSTMWRDGATFPGLKVLKVGSHLLNKLVQADSGEVGTLDNTEALADAKPMAELFAPGRVPWVHAVENAKQAERMS